MFHGPWGDLGEPGGDPVGELCEQIIFGAAPRGSYDGTMAADYDQLLEATIQHLEDLKTRGVRHVAVTPETLRALAQPVKSPVADFRFAAEKAPALRTLARTEA